MTEKEQGECEVVRGEHPDPLTRVCFEPATMRYPAMRGGYMHLCDRHGAKHARLVDEFGERWINGAWRSSGDMSHA